MRLALTLLLFAGCEASLTHPSDISPDIRQWWREAQEDVAKLVGPEAFDVHPSQFKFEAFDNPVPCDGPKGCYGRFVHGFARTPTIQYWRETPHAIRHEAGHAILWKLDKACFPDYEHIDYPYGCKK